jgi:hypothetical protein
VLMSNQSLINLDRVLLALARPWMLSSELKNQAWQAFWMGSRWSFCSCHRNGVQKISGGCQNWSQNYPRRYLCWRELRRKVFRLH